MNMKHLLLLISICCAFVFHNTTVFSQSMAEVVLSKNYLNTQQPIGYMLHSFSGEVLSYHIFTEKDQEKKHSIFIDQESIKHTALTIMFSADDEIFHNYSVYSLFDGYTIDEHSAYFFYNIHSSFSKYIADFSKYKDFKQISNFLSKHRISKTKLNGTHLFFGYNHRHPIIIPFEKNNNEEELFFYFDSESNKDFPEKQPISPIKRKNVFSTKRFVTFPLPFKGNWDCDMLLFSKKTELPFLIYQQVFEDSVKHIAAPEVLSLEKIGFIAKSHDQQHFMLEQEPFQAIHTNITKLNIDSFAFSPTSIFLDSKDATYFNGNLKYSIDKSSDVRYSWSVVGKVNEKVAIKIPTIPSAFITTFPAMKTFASPEKGSLKVFHLPDPIKENINLAYLADLNWLLKNRVSIFNLHADW